MKLQGIQINLASPKTIRQWAQVRGYSNVYLGQVKNAQTVNYQKASN